MFKMLDKRTDQVLRAIPTSVLVYLALASVIASAVLRIVGKRMLCVFIGQWPPTMLALAILKKLAKC
jgi:hypothetical protein